MITFCNSCNIETKTLVRTISRWELYIQVMTRGIYNFWIHCSTIGSKEIGQCAITIIKFQLITKTSSKRSTSDLKVVKCNLHYIITEKAASLDAPITFQVVAIIWWITRTCDSCIEPPCGINILWINWTT